MDLSAYYNEICKVPMLSKEEEFDLFMELGDEGLSAKERKKIETRIIQANLRFVFKQAKYYSKNDPYLFKELIGAGNEGLLVGLQKYDVKSGVRFLSYSGWWVNQRILKEMSKMRIVALPIWKQQLAARIQKATEGLESTPSFQELKKMFPEEKDKDLRELYDTKYLTYYLDDMTDCPEFEIDPIGTDVEVRLDRERICNVISDLPDIHRKIIEMSFGILDGEEVKQANIAKQLDISKDQLREYKKEALGMLREKLAGSL